MEKISSARKALVTGASGKIGNNLVKKLVSEGIHVYALTSKDSFKKMPGVTSIVHSWEKPINFSLPEVDVIFHLASQTSAYVARQDVSEDIRANLSTTVSILEATSHLISPPIFIFAGSMSEYGMSEFSKIDETVKISPRTFYDTAKICSEFYIEQFAREGIISKGITLRLSNVYGGTYISPEVDRGFIDKSIRNTIIGEPLILYGDGIYIRDYIYISDIVEAFYNGYIKSEDLLNNVYNIGTGQGTSVYGCLELIASIAKNITGKDFYIVKKDFPEDAYDIEKRNSVVDSTAFSRSTGWQSKVSLENGLIKTMETAWVNARTSINNSNH